MAEISFFLGVAEASFRGRVRSSDIQRDPLLLLVERSLLKWFGALVRMSPLVVFSACVTETRSGVDPYLVWSQEELTRLQETSGRMDRLKGGFELKCKAPLSDCWQCLAPRIIYRP